MGQGPARAPGGTQRGWGREGAAAAPQEARDGVPVAGCHCPHGCAEGGRATLLSPRKGVPWDRITEYLGSGGILKGHQVPALCHGQGQGQGHLLPQAPSNQASITARDRARTSLRVLSLSLTPKNPFLTSHQTHPAAV